MNDDGILSEAALTKEEAQLSTKMTSLIENHLKSISGKVATGERNAWHRLKNSFSNAVLKAKVNEIVAGRLTVMEEDIFDEAGLKIGTVLKEQIVNNPALIERNKQIVAQDMPKFVDKILVSIYTGMAQQALMARKKANEEVRNLLDAKTIGKLYGENKALFNEESGWEQGESEMENMIKSGLIPDDALEHIIDTLGKELGSKEGTIKEELDKTLKEIEKANEEITRKESDKKEIKGNLDEAEKSLETAIEKLFNSLKDQGATIAKDDFTDSIKSKLQSQMKALKTVYEKGTGSPKKKLEKIINKIEQIDLEINQEDSKKIDFTKLQNKLNKARTKTQTKKLKAGIEEMLNETNFEKRKEFVETSLSKDFYKSLSDYVGGNEALINETLDGVFIKLHDYIKNPSKQKKQGFNFEDIYAELKSKTQEKIDKLKAQKAKAQADLDGFVKKNVHSLLDSESKSKIEQLDKKIREGKDPKKIEEDKIDKEKIIKETLQNKDHTALLKIYEERKRIFEDQMKVFNEIEKLNQEITENKTSILKSSSEEEKIAETIPELEQKANYNKAQLKAIDASRVQTQTNQKLLESSEALGNISGNKLDLGKAAKNLMEDFGMYMYRIRMFQAGIKDIFEAMQSLQNMEDVAFELGIVSGMDIENIRKYRNELLLLANDYKATGEEIGKAQIQVVKTGMSLKEAQSIVESSLALSKATFATLEESTSSINKILLPLERSGEAAGKVAEWLYNIAVNTPASLASIDQALKQTGSVFSGLLDMVQLNGDALDSYKDKLIETQLSLIGLIHIQGKSGSMAGTALKMFVDRLRAPTATQEREVNQDLKKAGIKTDSGNQMTAQDISYMVNTNFNEALNMLSDMYRKGVLSQQTMSSIVGTRHVSTIQRMLIQIGGDMEGVNERYAEQKSLLESSNKSIESFSTEVEKMKNSFKSLKVIALDAADWTKGIVKIFGDVASATSEAASRNNVVKSGIQGVGTTAALVKTLGGLGILAAFAKTSTRTLSSSFITLGNSLRTVSIFSERALISLTRFVGISKQAIGAVLTVAGKLAGPLAILAAALTGIYYILNRFKELKGIEGAFKTESLANIQITIENMKIVDQTTTQLYTALNKLSFGMNSSTESAYYMSESLRELQRELEYSKKELQAFNISEFTKRYLDRRREELVKEGKLQPSEIESQLIKEQNMINKIQNKNINISQQDMGALENQLKYLPMEVSFFNKDELKKSSKTELITKVMNQIEINSVEELKLFLDLYKKFYEQVAENTELNKNQLEKNIDFLERFTKEYKNTMSLGDIKETTQKLGDKVSSAYLAHVMGFDKEFGEMFKNNLGLADSLKSKGKLIDYMSNLKLFEERMNENSKELEASLKDFGLNMQELSKFKVDKRIIPTKEYEKTIQKAQDLMPSSLKDYTNQTSDFFKEIEIEKADFLDKEIEKANRIKDSSFITDTVSKYKDFNVEQYNKLKELNSKMIDTSLGSMTTNMNSIISDISIKLMSDAGLTFDENQIKQYEDAFKNKFGDRNIDIGYKTKATGHLMSDVSRIKDVTRNDTLKTDTDAIEVKKLVDKYSSADSRYVKIIKSMVLNKIKEMGLTEDALNKASVKESVYKAFTAGTSSVKLTEEAKKTDMTLRKNIENIENEYKEAAKKLEDFKTKENITDTDAILRQGAEYEKAINGMYRDVADRDNNVKSDFVKGLLTSTKEERQVFLDILEKAYKEKKISEDSYVKTIKLVEQFDTQIYYQLEKKMREIDEALYDRLYATTIAVNAASGKIKQIQNELTYKGESFDTASKIKRLTPEIEKLKAESKKTIDVFYEAFISRSMGSMEDMKKEIDNEAKRIQTEITKLETSKAAEGADTAKIDEKIKQLKESLYTSNSMLQITDKTELVKRYAESISSLQNIDSALVEFISKDIDKLANLSYEDFSKQIKNNTTAEQIQILGEDGVKALYDLVTSKISLFKDLGISAGEIEKTQRVYNTFSKEMAKVRLDVDSLGFKDLSQELSNIYSTYSKEIKNRNTETLDLLEQQSKNAFSTTAFKNTKSSTTFDTYKTSAGAIDALTKSTNEQEKIALQKHIEYLKEKEKLDLEELKIKKQTLVSLMDFQKNLQNKMFENEKKLGLILPPTKDQYDNAAKGLRTNRLEQNLIMGSLKQNIKGTLESFGITDISDLFKMTDDEIKKVNLSNYDTALIKRLQALKTEEESQVLVLDKFISSLNYSGKLLSETEQKMVSFAKASAEYDKEQSPENFLNMRNAAYDAMLSDNTQTLKAFNDVMGVFNNVPAIQLEIGKNNLKILEEQIALTKQRATQEGNSFELQKQIATLNAQKLKQEQENTLQDIANRKTVYDLEERIYQTRSSTSFAVFENIQRSFADEIANINKSLSFQEEEIKARYDSQIEAIKSLSENSFKVDKNTIATEELTKVLSMTLKGRLVEQQQGLGKSLKDIYNKGQDLITTSGIGNQTNLKFDEMSSIVSGNEDMGTNLKNQNPELYKLAEQYNEYQSKLSIINSELDKLDKLSSSSPEDKKSDLKQKATEYTLQLEKLKALELQLAREEAIAKIDKAQMELKQKHLEKYGQMYNILDAIVKQDFSAFSSSNASVGDIAGNIYGLLNFDTKKQEIIEQKKQSVFEKYQSRIDSKNPRISKAAYGEMQKELQDTESSTESALTLQKYTAIAQTAVQTVQLIGNAIYNQKVKELQLDIKSYENEKKILDLQTQLVNSPRMKAAIQALSAQKDEQIFNTQQKMARQQADQATFNTTTNMAMQGITSGALIGGVPGAIAGGVIGTVAGWLGGNKAKKELKEQQKQETELRNYEKYVKAMVELKNSFDAYNQSLLSYIQEFRDKAKLFAESGKSLRGLKTQAEQNAESAKENILNSPYDVTPLVGNSFFTKRRTGSKQIGWDYAKNQPILEDWVRYENEQRDANFTLTSSIPEMFRLSQSDSTQQILDKISASPVNETFLVDWMNSNKALFSATAFGTEENYNLIFKYNELTKQIEYSGERIDDASKTITGTFSSEATQAWISEMSNAIIDFKNDLLTAVRGWNSIINSAFYANKEGFEITTRDSEKTKLEDSYTKKVNLLLARRSAYDEMLKREEYQGENNKKARDEIISKRDDIEKELNTEDQLYKKHNDDLEARFGQFNEVYTSTFSKDNFQKILEGAKLGQNLTDAFAIAMGETLGKLTNNIRKTMFEAYWQTTTVNGVNISDALDSIVERTADYLKNIFTKTLDGTPEEKKAAADKIASFIDQDTGLVNFNKLGEASKLGPKEINKITNDMFNTIEEINKLKSQKQILRRGENESDDDWNKRVKANQELDDKIKKLEETLINLEETLKTGSMNINDVFKASYETVAKSPYINWYKSTEVLENQMLESVEGLTESQARAASIAAGLPDIWADALNKMSDMNIILRLSHAKLAKERQEFLSTKATDANESREKRIESLRIQKLKAKDVDAFNKSEEGQELIGLEKALRMFDMREKVYTSFEEGIKSALEAGNYIDKIKTFSNLFGDELKTVFAQSLEGFMTTQSEILADALATGDWSTAVNVMNETYSQTKTFNEDLRESLRQLGVIETLIDDIAQSKYAGLEQELSKDTTFGKYLMNIQKRKIDYETEDTEVVTKGLDKFKNLVDIKLTLPKKDAYDNILRKLREGFTLTPDEEKFKVEYEKLQLKFKIETDVMNGFISGFDSALSGEYTSMLNTFGKTISETVKRNLLEGMELSFAQATPAITEMLADGLTTEATNFIQYITNEGMKVYEQQYAKYQSLMSEGKMSSQAASLATGISEATPVQNGIRMVGSNVDKFLYSLDVREANLDNKIVDTPYKIDGGAAKDAADESYDPIHQVGAWNTVISQMEGTNLLDVIIAINAGDDATLTVLNSVSDAIKSGEEVSETGLSTLAQQLSGLGLTSEQTTEYLKSLVDKDGNRVFADDAIAKALTGIEFTLPAEASEALTKAREVVDKLIKQYEESQKPNDQKQTEKLISIEKYAEYQSRLMELLVKVNQTSLGIDSLFYTEIQNTLHKNTNELLIALGAKSMGTSEGVDYTKIVTEVIKETVEKPKVDTTNSTNTTTTNTDTKDAATTSPTDAKGTTASTDPNATDTNNATTEDPTIRDKVLDKLIENNNGKEAVVAILKEFKTGGKFASIPLFSPAYKTLVDSATSVNKSKGMSGETTPVKMKNAEYIRGLESKKASGVALTAEEENDLNDYYKEKKHIELSREIANGINNGMLQALASTDFAQRIGQIGSSIGSKFQEHLRDAIDFTGQIQSIIKKIDTKNFTATKTEVVELQNTILTQQNEAFKTRDDLIKTGILPAMADAMLGTTSKFQDIVQFASTVTPLRSDILALEKNQKDYQLEQIKDPMSGALLERKSLMDQLYQKQAEGYDLTLAELNLLHQYESTLASIDQRRSLANSITSSVQSAFNSDTFESTLQTFGSTVGNVLSTALGKSLENSLKLSLTNLLNADDAITNMSVSGLYNASQEAQALAAKTYAYQQQYKGLVDMFSAKNLEFNDQTKKIEYTSQASTSTYNITYNSTISTNALIGSGVDMDRLAKSLAPYVKKHLAKL